MICDNCEKRWEIVKSSDWNYQLRTLTDDVELCSLDCIIDYAWKLREAQPKLSKSKAD